MKITDRFDPSAGWKKEQIDIASVLCHEEGSGLDDSHVSQF